MSGSEHRLNPLPIDKHILRPCFVLVTIRVGEYFSLFQLSAISYMPIALKQKSPYHLSDRGFLR